MGLGVSGQLPACRRQSRFPFPDLFFFANYSRPVYLDNAFAFANARFSQDSPVATRSRMINTRFIVAIQMEEGGLAERPRK